MPSTPSAPHRRDLRRWDRRRRRTTARRRLWVVAAVASVLAVGPAIHLVAPGSRADALEQLAALVPVDSQRSADAASRSSERSASPTTDAAGDGSATTEGSADPTSPDPTGTQTADPSVAPSSGPTADVPSDSSSDPAAGGTGEDPASGGAAGAQGQAAASGSDAATSAGQPAAAAPGGATTSGSAAAPTLTQQVVDLTNAERAAAGLPALAVSACATAQAQSRTDVLVAEDRFEHDPLGPVMRACGAGGVGENLALGYRDAATMVAGWMGSQGHRENILRPGYTSIGVACTSGSRGLLCAQVFLS